MVDPPLAAPIPACDGEELVDCLTFPGDAGSLNDAGDESFVCTVDSLVSRSSKMVETAELFGLINGGDEIFSCGPIDLLRSSMKCEIDPNDSVLAVEFSDSDPPPAPENTDSACDPIESKFPPISTFSEDADDVEDPVLANSDDASGACDCDVYVECSSMREGLNLS